MKTEITRIVAGVQRLLPDVPAQAVQDFFSAPTTIAIFDKRAADALARRKALVARRAALPGESAARQADANKAMGAARERYQLAEAELKTANVAVMETTAVASGLNNMLHRELAQTERELIESADPRLAETIWILGDIFQAVRNNLDWQLTIDHHFETSGRSITSVVHNGADVERAVSLIRELQAKCRAMQLQALPEDAITQELRAMTLDLSALLAPLSALDGITITDEGAVVRQRVHKHAAIPVPVPRAPGRAAQQHGSAA